VSILVVETARGPGHRWSGNEQDVDT
jgi:hypothetical protein